MVPPRPGFSLYLPAPSILGLAFAREALTLFDSELWARKWRSVMTVSYTYRSSLRRRRSFHHIGIAAACMATLVGLAFIAAGVLRLELLQEAHRELFPMALGIALVALCVLSIASYVIVRAIEWASRH